MRHSFYITLLLLLLGLSSKSQNTLLPLLTPNIYKEEPAFAPDSMIRIFLNTANVSPDTFSIRFFWHNDRQLDSLKQIDYEFPDIWPMSTRVLFNFDSYDRCTSRREANLLLDTSYTGMDWRYNAEGNLISRMLKNLPNIINGDTLIYDLAAGKPQEIALHRVLRTNIISTTRASNIVWTNNQLSGFNIKYATSSNWIEYYSDLTWEISPSPNNLYLLPPYAPEIANQPIIPQPQIEQWHYYPSSGKMTVKNAQGVQIRDSARWQGTGSNNCWQTLQWDQQQQGIWQPDSQLVFSYHPEGWIESIITRRFVGGAWQNQRKSIWIRNAFNHLVSEQRHDYDHLSQLWRLAHKFDYEYEYHRYSPGLPKTISTYLTDSSATNRKIELRQFFVFDKPDTLVGTIINRPVVYPNPFNAFFMVNLKNATGDLWLFDGRGKLLKTQVLQRGDNYISTHDLAAGPYLVRVTTEDQDTSERLIKIH